MSDMYYTRTIYSNVTVRDYSGAWSLRKDIIYYPWSPSFFDNGLKTCWNESGLFLWSLVGLNTSRLRASPRLI